MSEPSCPACDQKIAAPEDGADASGSMRIDVECPGCGRPLTWFADGDPAGRWIRDEGAEGRVRMGLGPGASSALRPKVDEMDASLTPAERSALALLGQEGTSGKRGTASIAAAMGSDVEETLDLLRKLQAQQLVACEGDVGLGEEVWVVTQAGVASLN